MTKKATLWTACAATACLLPMTAVAQGYLENPVAGSIESGIGLVSGWHCTAQEVRVFIDGVDIGKSGVGSIRNDTASICGQVNTGFSVLYNYNKLTPGPHTVSVYVDGAHLETRQFSSVRSGGVPYLDGASGAAVVANFPQAGVKTHLTWSQAKQGFIVVGSEVDNPMAMMEALTNKIIHGSTFRPGGPIAGDPTSFEFFLMGAFLMEIRSSSAGPCFFTGDYSFSPSGVSSDGTYQCEDSRRGNYRAHGLQVNELGVFSGTLTRTPQGSTESVTETYAGYDVYREERGF